MSWTIVKHILVSASLAAAVVFLMDIQTDGADVFGKDAWWPIAAAVLSYLLQRVKAVEAAENGGA